MIEAWDDQYDDWDHGCDHEDYTVDILTGRCECDRCPVSWQATNEQVEREIEHQRKWHEYQERENRREFWRHKFRWPIQLWDRIKGLMSGDPKDGIPF